MRLFILGATGGIGTALIQQGRERGHEITAFVRSPHKLGRLARDIDVVKGDPTDVAALIDALPGHDAVLSALGPSGIGPTRIHRDAARSTAGAMHIAGVSRLLIVSAAVLFPDSGFLTAFARKTFLRNVTEDCEAMERIVAASNLDWTIVRPPRLTNGPLTRHYRFEPGRLPNGRLSVSRADVAHFLLDELERREHVRAIVGLTAARKSLHEKERNSNHHDHSFDGVVRTYRERVAALQLYGGRVAQPWIAVGEHA